MNCGICGKKDPAGFYLLPLIQKDGSLCTFACEDCAKKSSAYCARHDNIHQGFADGTTACLDCVEEVVEQNRSEANTIAAKIFGAIPPKELIALTKASKASSIVTGDHRNVSILRIIAANAARTRKTFEEVEAEILRRHSIGFVISIPFYLSEDDY